MGFCVDVVPGIDEEVSAFECPSLPFLPETFEVSGVKLPFLVVICVLCFLQLCVLS